MTPPRLPDSTEMAFVHLRVSDVERVSQFYTRELGFVRSSDENGNISFSSGQDRPPILYLSEDRAAQRVTRSPGLYHVAYLYPARKELAKAFRRLYEHRYPFQGFADHGVSEALYLADPEGNGIELYADRPREQWQLKDRQLQMGTEPLNLDNLVAELDHQDDGVFKLDPLTKIGHVHLQVSDLVKAERFYHEIVGFDVIVRSYPGALFVSAGGYHHHLGLNTWHSRGAAIPREKSLGLVSYGIRVGNKDSFEGLRNKLKESKAIIDETATSVVAHDLDGLNVEFLQ